ncbi:MAG: carbohydrate-binding protein [Bacteroidales bacterium]|nr:carbohydrate-binding protein [Bacteroidales bacterium]
MPSTPTSLNLPIKELPEVAWGDPNSSDWGNVADYLLPEDGTDITNALQAAIDAGHKTVYIPYTVNGSSYVGLTSTVYVRDNCERIISLGARFADNSPGKIEIVDGNSSTVILERLRGAYSKIQYIMNTSRTVVITSLPTGFGGVPLVSNGTGDLHIVDVAGQFHFNNPSQNIWCRQINPESDFFGVLNKGANLVIIGTKTEGGETKVRTTLGGKTEVLGGQVFTNVKFTTASGPDDPLIDNIFEVENSSFSFAGIHRRLANTDRSPYNHWVKETRGSEVRYMDTDASTFDEPIALFVANQGAITTPPDAPSGLTATAVGFRIDLTWVDNATDELAFEVQRATNSSFTKNVEYMIAGKNATAYSDKGLEIATTYYYRVRAFDEGTYSSWSNTTSSTTGSLGSGSGLRGEYWNRMPNTYNFTGNPDLTKIDSVVNFNWGSGSIGAPEDTSIQKDYVTVRWTGQVEPFYTEDYTFSTFTDDGVRLWVNNVLVIDKWIAFYGTANGTPISLSAGVKYNIKMEYFEGGGGAQAKLYWQSASQAKEIIPSSQLFSVIGPEEFTITPIAGPNGAISPSGALGYEEGTDQTFTIVPNAGYLVNNVWINGKSSGAITSYTFTNISANHTIQATFKPDVPKGPYGGTPWTINNGAVIEAEDYDLGGQNVSYYDLTPGNNGSSYRTDDVDVEATADTLGGYNIGWSSPGEWLEYTSNVSSGLYNINVRVASKENTGDIQVSLDGVVLGIIDISPTGEWQAWETFTLDSVSITGGNGKVLRLTFVNGGNINFNRISFENLADEVQYTINATAGSNGSISPSGAINVSEGGDQTFTITPNSGYQIANVLVNGTSVGAVSSYTFSNVTANHTISATFNLIPISGASIPGKIEAEDYDAMSGIQTQSTSDVGGGLNVGWINAGDWMDYEVNVTSAGTYTVEYRVASPNNTGQVQLLSGGTVLATTNIPNTGNWQAWTTVSATVNLVAGTQTLRVYASGSGWNINWLSFVSVIVTPTYTITASAGPNGFISPSGPVGVTEGNNQTFAITPDGGYVIEDVLVDGSSVGAVSSHTFHNVAANHSISATFIAEVSKLPDVTIADYRFSSTLSSSDTDLNTTAGNFTDGPGIVGGTSYWDGGRQ